MKPRLRKYRHLWECFGVHGSVIGPTPFQAWWDYIALGEVIVWSENRELERGR